MKKLLLFLFTISFSACTPKGAGKEQSKAESKKDTSIQIVKDAIADNFEFVYSLVPNDEIRIGDIYAKWKNDSIFTDLYVVNKKDTIYSIKKNIFSNSLGFDMEAADENFNGYIFALKKNNYFIVYLTNEKGEGASDPAVIKWNNEEKIMEFVRTP